MLAPQSLLLDLDAVLAGNGGLLERLALRLPMSVVTDRPRAEATRILAASGIAGFVHDIVRREDEPARPTIERAWMVGSTPDVLRAARASGVLPLGIVSRRRRFATRRRITRSAARILTQLEELEELLP